MKTKLSLLAVALLSLALLGACKKQEEASAEMGQDAATAINGTLDKAQDAAAATEAAAKATADQAAAEVAEAKEEAVDAIQAAKDATAAEAAK